MADVYTQKNILVTLKTETYSVKNGNKIPFSDRVISIFKAVEAVFASKSFPFLESFLYIASIIVFVRNGIGIDQ